MRYELPENDPSGIIDLYNNIRLKGHFSQDWIYYWRHNGSSDGNLRQNYDSEYTVVPIDSYLPSKGQVDFQIEALIVYLIKRKQSQHPIKQIQEAVGAFSSRFFAQDRSRWNYYANCKEHCSKYEGHAAHCRLEISYDYFVSYQASPKDATSC